MNTGPPVPAWRHCPDCGATGSVTDGICSLCLSDPGERGGGRPPAALGASARAEPLRFSEVLDELRIVVDLADSGEGGEPIAAAGRRAERLLDALRVQFVRDLGAPLVGPAGAHGAHTD